ncbi:MAG: hypothetical protein KKF50_00275 [Nanoarchaeota archaeon]|nr:hypothetical protein [Nanoarchaeota archaeon]
MAKVTFISDIEKDMENIWNKCNKKPKFGNFKINPSLEKICIGKKFEEAKPELEKYLKATYDSPYIETFRKVMQELWDKIEVQFFDRMNSLMKKEYKKEIKSYITTLNICPYNPLEPSFIVSLFYPLQRAILTCGHEIMHLYFHEFYWNEVEKRIGPKKTGDLKEALTILLNLEFIDLWLTRDGGYNEHKELREFISKTWKEEKDIEKLLEKCIIFLNNSTES